MSMSYELILSPSEELLGKLLFLIISIGGVIVSAGIVAQLMKPYWIAVIAFLLSSLAIMAGWQQFTITAGIILLVYFVICCYAVIRVQLEQKERLHFSIRPYKDSLGLFSIALLIVACGSIFVGSKDIIDRNGFETPVSYMNLFMDPFKEQVLSQVPDDERAMVEEEFEEQTQVSGDDRRIYRENKAVREIHSLDNSRCVFYASIDCQSSSIFYLAISFTNSNKSFHRCQIHKDCHRDKGRRKSNS